jgi:NADH dehydrogenase FAD-containing subunit
MPSSIFLSMTSHAGSTSEVADAHAELVAGEVVLVEPEKQIVHTHAGAQMEYDALVLALGAVARPL